MVRCYVALGANLGEPIRIVQAAIDALKSIEGAQFVVASSLYRTAPVGLVHQPDFINAVVALDLGGEGLCSGTVISPRSRRAQNGKRPPDSMMSAVIASRVNIAEFSECPSSFS